MNGKTGNPTFRIDEKPPRPKTLKELYDLMVKTCQNAGHNEEKFIRSVITQLEKDPIRTYSRKYEISKKGLDFGLITNFPLNDYWTAAENYLKNLGVANAEINKFNTIMNNGFS